MPPRVTVEELRECAALCQQVILRNAADPNSPPGGSWVLRQIAVLLDRGIRGDRVYGSEVAEFISDVKLAGQWRVERLGEDCYGEERARFIIIMRRWIAELPDSAVGSRCPRLSVAERIKQRRKELGWSQRQLAHKLGVDPRTVKKWESGSLPSRSHARALAELSDLPIHYFEED